MIFGNVTHMPEPLLEFVNSNERFGLSRKSNTGQGCNFLHEDLSKQKSLLLTKMLRNEVWARVCMKLKDLEEIRDSFVKQTATREF